MLREQIGEASTLPRCPLAVNVAVLIVQREAELITKAAKCPFDAVCDGTLDRRLVLLGRGRLAIALCRGNLRADILTRHCPNHDSHEGGIDHATGCVDRLLLVHAIRPPKVAEATVRGLDHHPSRNVGWAAGGG